MKKLLLLFVSLAFFAYADAKKIKFDYSIVFVPEEGGVKFEKITDDNDMVASYKNGLVGNTSGIFGSKNTFRRRTLPVRSFPCNKFGLFEMHGNVCEWCRDPERFFEDKDVEFLAKGDAATNNASMALTKGGGWRSNWLQCACSCNNYHAITGKSDELGFRAAIVATKR